MNAYILFRVLYRITELNQQDPTKKDVVLDVNELPKDDCVALGAYHPSADGSLLAYSLTVNGSEWHTIKIRNVDTLKDYKEELKYVRYSSIFWYRGNEGFFYIVCI